MLVTPNQSLVKTLQEYTECDMSIKYQKFVEIKDVNFYITIIFFFNSNLSTPVFVSSSEN